MQIGPRIRVGGTLGKIGESVKHGVGDVLSNPIVKGAGALALGATGVGAPLAAGIVGGAGLLGGALKTGGSTGAALSGALSGAGMGYGGAKLGAYGAGMLGGDGAPSAVDGFGFGGSSIADKLKGALGLGGAGGGAGGAGSWLGPAISAVGGLAGGALDARQAGQDRAERQREFDAQFGLDQSRFGLEKGTYDYKRANDQASAPLKMALIQALLGRTGVAGSR